MMAFPLLCSAADVLTFYIHIQSVLQQIQRLNSVDILDLTTSQINECEHYFVIEIRDRQPTNKDKTVLWTLLI